MPDPLPLAALRAAAGLSQRELAEASGVKRSMINEIEGGRKTPSLGTAIKLADALDCTLDELAGRKSPEIRRPARAT